jgi:hypothetical protein
MSNITPEEIRKIVEQEVNKIKSADNIQMYYFCMGKGECIVQSTASLDLCDNPECKNCQGLHNAMKEEVKTKIGKQLPLNYNKDMENQNLNFGQAIEAAKAGKRVARTGWNGSGMFAYIVPAASYPAQTGAAKAHFGENALVPYRAYWALKTAQEDIATWTPSGSDSLAEDWVILD